MSTDGDLIREVLDEFFQDTVDRGRSGEGIYGRREKAFAALARLEAAEAQRDALAEALVTLRRFAREVDVQAAFAQGGVDVDAVVATIAPADPPEDETEFIHAVENL